MNKRFLWLDAARGIAALAVMIYHCDLFLHIAPLFHSSYLAVDLFFQMSGFVLAHAYQAKLANGSMSFGRFMVIRLVRLYPIYAIGTLITAVYYFSKILLAQYNAPTLHDLVTLIGLGALFLPNPGIVTQPEGIFPLAPSTWSLCLEMVLSLIYGFFLFRASRYWIGGLTLALLGLFLYAAFGAQSFDLGWNWSNFGGGFFRSTASFLIGFIAYHIYLARSAILPSLHVALLAACAVVFVLLPREPLWPALLAILLLFPAVLLSTPQKDPKGPVAVACHELGRISYPIYVLHTPILLWLAAGLKPLLGEDLSQWPSWVGALMALMTVALSYAATVWLDEPIRAWLSSQLRRRTPVSATAKAP